MGVNILMSKQNENPFANFGTLIQRSILSYFEQFDPTVLNTWTVSQKDMHVTVLIKSSSIPGVTPPPPPPPPRATYLRQ